MSVLIEIGRIFLLFVEIIFKACLAFMGSALLWAIICEAIHDDK